MAENVQPVNKYYFSKVSTMMMSCFSSASAAISAGIMPCSSTAKMNRNVTGRDTGRVNHVSRNSCRASLDRGVGAARTCVS